MLRCVDNFLFRPGIPRYHNQTMYHVEHLTEFMVIHQIVIPEKSIMDLAELIGISKSERSTGYRLYHGDPPAFTKFHDLNYSLLE
jgi:hypothetical protein